MANSVQLIDPIKSVSNLPNGTPEYEDLFIFAELIGGRRERSVLTLNSNQNNVSLETQLSNTNVNMLGVDFKKDVNDSATFTTNWTNNESNITTTLEGFGIKQIDVNINSSFIPTVTIEFVDIRGMTFFNQGENSPYSLLFDFPPPLFKMTLKGYYGKSLDYDLHLVKHNTRFDSKSGNYYITTEFIARTFAPLADVPFKYAELLSLMKTGTAKKTDPKVQESAISDINNTTNQEELNFDPRVEPRNTYELVQKLKRLTDELKDIKNTSEESEILNDANAGVENGDELINFMDDFSDSLNSNIKDNSEIVIFNDSNDIENSGGDTGSFKIVKSTTQYNDIIRQSTDAGDNSRNENTKLYLAVLSKKVRDNNLIEPSTGTSVNIIGGLTNYSKSLINKGKQFARNEIKDNDIKNPLSIINNNPVDNNSENDYDLYVAIDITKFYTKINKELKSKKDNVEIAQNDLVKIINSKVKNILGFKPSIYNIFKILCDDLDIFFKQLGKISIDSETHHNKYFNLIIDQIQEKKSKTKTKKIYPFPLYVEEDTTCSVTRKTRKIPNFKIDEQFPEVKFINEFIDTMIRVKKEESVAEMKTKVDSNGNNEWIPITPADSKLFGTNNYSSPYTNLEFDEATSSIDALYSRIINRFYIASQYTFGDSFYSDEKNAGIIGIPLPYSFVYLGGGRLKKNDIIRYIAKSEAINVSNSIINDDIINSLLDKSSEKGFKKNPQRFFDEIKNLSIYNTIPNNELKLSDNEIILKRDRTDPDFIGMEILNDSPSLRVENDNNDPINKFLKDTENNFIDWMFNNNRSKIKEFTIENIPYFADNSDENLTTAFLNRLNDNILKDFTGTENLIESLFNNGNYDRRKNGNFKDTLLWSISYYTSEIDDFLNSNNNILTKAFVISSLFGSARSYFSEEGEDDKLNNKFLTPAVIELPNFTTYYMGSLITYNTNPIVKNEIDNLLTQNWFRVLSNNGKFIKDDTNRIKKLSSKDSEKFLEKLNQWLNLNNSGYNDFTGFIEFLIDELINEGLLNESEEKKYRFINTLTEQSLDEITDDMMKTISILNFSEYTFKNLDDITPLLYQPLAETNQISDRNTSNNLYFNVFWSELGKLLPNKKDELNEIESDFNSVVDDEDIKTQLYYSFKNISDKWISGIDTSKRGFPLNVDENDSLISKFAFVDRAMNPIGDDVIINAESLIEMSKDFDLNMFQVFSRLLSLNGFEFFPLQNFMSFNNSDWEDAFKQFTTLEQKPTPAFVCMYIGGTSSTLENESSSFDNDGILNLEEEGLPDFHVGDGCDDSNEVIDSNERSRNSNETKFKYSEPKAFRVRFAEQNQSFFTSIQLEGKEFTETADSLAILSRIAGDGKSTAPTPKGQNLFSVYENRAYSVTVTMLGNVMIQPTQYFQLENIPMYSGAYMITNVKHHIKANHMTTEFEGVKILKFPNPFVKNFATIVGIESGTSEDTSGNNASIEIISATTLPDKELYNNSMFDLKLSP